MTCPHRVDRQCEATPPGMWDCDTDCQYIDELRTRAEKAEADAREAHAEVERLAGLLRRIPGVLCVDGRPELWCSSVSSPTERPCETCAEIRVCDGPHDCSHHPVEAMKAEIEPNTCGTCSHFVVPPKGECAEMGASTRETDTCDDWTPRDGGGGER